MKKKEFIYGAVFVALGGAFFYLFNAFIIGKYASDFPSHIRGAIGGEGYSLMHILIKTVVQMGWGDRSRRWGLSLLMTLIVLCTIVVSSVLLSYILTLLTKKKMNCKKWIEYVPFGMTFVFLCNIYIPGLWPHFYVKQTGVTQPWHNSTFLLMRLLGTVLIILFLYIQEEYLTEHIKLTEWLLFVLVLTGTNMAKPSFILGFAPIMLVTLIYDFVSTRAKSFRNAFAWGVGVLISLAVLIVQYQILYNSDDGSQIILNMDLFKEFIKPQNVLGSMLSNYLFPIVVTIIVVWCNRFTERKITERYLWQGWGMYAVSRGEAIFLAETGIRMNDGNFDWGEYYFGYLLYIICCGYLLYICQNENDSGLKKLTWIPYGLNIFTGFVYFVLLCTRSGYLF